MCRFARSVIGPLHERAEGDAVGEDLLHQDLRLHRQQRVAQPQVVGRVLEVLPIASLK